MKKYKIGYTCGVFDLIHEGHIILLERCKSLCEQLIVGICDDDYVRNIKRNYPIYTQEQRLIIMNSIKFVDRAELVSVEETMDKLLAHKKYNFDVLFSGDDWKDSDRYKQASISLQKAGVDTVFFPYTHNISTTLLREKMMMQIQLPQQTKNRHINHK